jgi:hypothetical protein
MKSSISTNIRPWLRLLENHVEVNDRLSFQEEVEESSGEKIESRSGRNLEAEALIYNKGSSACR